MQLVLRNSLLFTTVRVIHRGSSLDVADVLVDTGSASTVLSADAVAPLSISPEPGDRLRTLRGIGGRELVFTNGILGMDFLLGMGAVVDLAKLTIGWTP